MAAIKLAETARQNGHAQKRGKKNPLSASGKGRNQAVSSGRAGAGNVIARLKRFKIIAGRYRNRPVSACVSFSLPSLTR